MSPNYYNTNKRRLFLLFLTGVVFGSLILGKHYLSWWRASNNGGMDVSSLDLVSEEIPEYINIESKQIEVQKKQRVVVLVSIHS